MSIVSMLMSFPIHSSIGRKPWYYKFTLACFSCELQASMLSRVKLGAVGKARGKCPFALLHVLG